MPTLTPTRFDVFVSTVKPKFDALTPEKREEISRSLDITSEEHFRFQEVKSFAQMHQKISFEEAQQVYVRLGEGGPDRFNKLPVEEKYTLTVLFEELIKWQISELRRG
jgi:hypothetical protein